MRQWHPRRWVWAWIGIIIGAIPTVWVTILLNRKYEGVLSGTNVKGETDPTMAGVGVVLGLSIICVGGLGYGLYKLFPDPAFRVGDGITRHDALRTVRSRLFWLIVGSAGLGLLVRAIGAFL